MIGAYFAGNLYNFQKRIEMRLRLGDLEDSDEEEAKAERASMFEFNLTKQVENMRASTGMPKKAQEKKIKKVRGKKEFTVGKSPRSQSADASKK